MSEKTTQLSLVSVQTQFWEHIGQYYPMTAWWWKDEPPARGWLSPWTQTRFDHERVAWRELAVHAHLVEDVQASHWARFARLAEGWLSSQAWQEAWRPLSYALRMSQWLALAAEEERDAFLRQLPDWLENMDAVVITSGAGQERLNRVVDRFAWRLRNSFSAYSGLQAALDALVHAIDRIPMQKHPIEPPSWVHVAHISMQEWRRRRNVLGADIVNKAQRILSPKDLLLAVKPHVEPNMTLAARPDMPGWWLRPGDPDTLYYHPSLSGLDLMPALGLSLWRHKTSLLPLTWVLTPPPIVVGGSLAFSVQLAKQSPEWRPQRYGILPQWGQIQRALAVCDAWLWGDGEDPARVVSWLARYLPSDLAWSEVYDLVVNHGYYILADQVFDWFTGTEGFSTNSTLEILGPIMPYELFVTPRWLGDAHAKTTERPQ